MEDFNFPRPHFFVFFFCGKFSFWSTTRMVCWRCGGSPLLHVNAENSHSAVALQDGAVVAPKNFLIKKINLAYFFQSYFGCNYKIYKTEEKNERNWKFRTRPDEERNSLLVGLSACTRPLGAAIFFFCPQPLGIFSLIYKNDEIESFKQH